MKRPTLIIPLLFLFVSTASAQENWREELGKDLVEIKDDKLVIEDFFLFKINLEGYEPVSLQVKVYGEAPEDGIISRDNFISLATLVSYQTLYGTFAEYYQVAASQFIQATEIDDLVNPIGTPDFEIAIFVTDEGMQIELANTSTGQRNRITSTWAEMYAN